MLRLLSVLLFAFGVVNLPAAVGNQEDKAAAPEAVRVVIKTAPAFVEIVSHPPRGGRPVQLADGFVSDSMVRIKASDLGGYAIELWQKVVQEFNAESGREGPLLQSVFTDDAGSVDSMVKQLVEGEADVGLGAISINEPRMRAVDFSIPIYESGFQVMVAADRVPADFSSLLVPFRQLLKRENLVWILSLAGILLVISHLVWVAERRINARAFPDQYHRGIGETVWWSLSTLLSGGCEEKPVQGRAGRFVALLWMFGALMFATFVQSTVTTSMVTGDGGALHGLESFDARTVRFGAQSNTAASYWITNTNTPPPVEIPRPQFWPEREQVIVALRAGRIDGWIHDSPILHHYSRKYPDLKVLGKVYGPHSYAFIFRKGFPYRERIDRILVRLKSRGEFERLEKRWIGDLAKTRKSA